MTNIVHKIMVVLGEQSRPMTREEIIEKVTGMKITQVRYFLRQEIINIIKDFEQNGYIKTWENTNVVLTQQGKGQVKIAKNFIAFVDLEEKNKRRLQNIPAEIKILGETISELETARNLVVQSIETRIEINKDKIKKLFEELSELQKPLNLADTPKQEEKK